MSRMIQNDPGGRAASGNRNGAGSAASGNHDGAAGAASGNHDGAGSADNEIVPIDFSSLFDIPDHLLMRVIRSELVHEGTTFFLKNLKQVNRRLYLQIRHEMFLHHGFRDAVHALSLIVPGTKIPCGAELVTVPETPSNFVQYLEGFVRNAITAPNGLSVGGIMQPAHYGDLGVWSVSPTIAGQPLTYYLRVSITFRSSDFLQGLPQNTANTTNLALVPNIVRAVVRFTSLTEHTRVVDRACGVTAIYARLVRVRINTTMQAIFNAIAYAEGWNMGVFAMSIGNNVVLYPQGTVAELIEIARNNGAPAGPKIMWPDMPQTHQVAASSDGSGPSSDDEGSSSDHDGNQDALDAVIDSFKRSLQPGENESDDNRDAVHALSLVVPGTKIPCGAELVTVPESPSDFLEYHEVFRRKVVAAPNGVLVGGIMNPTHYGEFGAWRVPSVVDIPGHEATYYLLVSITFDSEDFLEDLPQTTPNTTSLASVPDIVRAVLGFTSLTEDTQVVDREGVTGIYARLICVGTNTTMQAIFNAIAYAEGWNMSVFAMSFGDNEMLYPQGTVAELIERANNIGASVSLQMAWPDVEPGHQVAASISDITTCSSCFRCPSAV